MAEAKLRVTLLSPTSNPIAIIGTAAKLCYSDKDPEDIYDHISSIQSKMMIDKLEESGHLSPLEHVQFTFAVSGVSRVLLAQLTRHRIASFSVRSQRYVNESAFDYIIPQSIKDSEKALEIYEHEMSYLTVVYDQLVDAIVESEMQKRKLDGSAIDTITKLKKKAQEDARYVLPNACETKLIVSMNVRELHHFFGLRCCNRAQAEIREMACEMFKLCYRISPALFEHAGPSCVATGRCSEGKMSCGNSQQQIDKFNEIKATVRKEQV